MDSWIPTIASCSHGFGDVSKQTTYYLGMMHGIVCFGVGYCKLWFGFASVQLEDQDMYDFWID